MPYRRNKRNSRRRRRRSQSKRRWEDFLADTKRMYGTQKYFNEDRDGSASMEIAVNQVGFQAIVCMGCPTIDKAYIAATLGQDGGALGEQEQGNGADMLLNTTNTNIAKHYISNEKQVVHIRNVSLHPVYTRVYECQAKRDIASVDGTYQVGRTIALHDFAVGLKDYMAAGSSTTALYEGDGIISYTAGDVAGTLRSKFIGPMRSPRFRQNWKIVKQHRYKLSPGDDVFWKMKVRNHILDPTLDTTDNGSQIEDSRKVRGGLTKVLLVFAHGSIGVIDGDANTMGFLASHLAIDTIQSASVMPINFGESNQSSSVHVDTDAALAAIVGPSEHVDVGDE